MSKLKLSWVSRLFGTQGCLVRCLKVEEIGSRGII